MRPICPLFQRQPDAARLLRQGARVVVWVACAPWACGPQLPPPKSSPQAAALGHVEVRLARIEAQMADLAMQAQMAQAQQNQLAQGRAAAQGGAAGTALAAGAEALTRGQFAQAQGHFAHALGKAEPRSADAAQALMGLGDIAVAQGAQGIAVQHLTRLLAEHPAHPRLREGTLKLALAHEALGAAAQADEIYLNIVAQHPGSPQAKVARERLASRERGSL